MMPEWIKYVLPFLTGGGMAGAWSWIRSRKKDSAEVNKVQAETKVLLQSIESEKIKDEAVKVKTNLDLSQTLSIELYKALDRLNQTQIELDNSRALMREIQNKLFEMDERLEAAQRELNNERAEKNELLELLEKIKNNPDGNA